MPKTRAIRFSDSEERLIKEFLGKNPIFDFSTMARAAVRQFITNPQISMTAIAIPDQFAERAGKRRNPDA
jgi:hypothetical protein